MTNGISSEGGNLATSTMTAENAIQILNSRKLIVEPGKYNLKVTNVTPFEKNVIGGDDLLTNIVNFAGMTTFHRTEAKRFLKAGNFQEATNQNLTASRRIGLDYTPKKGEICEVIVDYVALRDFLPWANPDGANGPDEDPRFPNGRIGQQGLLVIGVQAMPLAKAINASFSMDDLVDGTEEDGEGVIEEANLVSEKDGKDANTKASIKSAEAKVAEKEALEA